MLQTVIIHVAMRRTNGASDGKTPIGRRALAVPILSNQARPCRCMEDVRINSVKGMSNLAHALSYPLLYMAASM